jgi:3-mercaptopyruvate sulfurtransferase SseA
MVLFVGTFTLTGCGSGGGSDDYDAPEGQSSPVLPGQVDDVLIDAKTLKGWVDAGLVNKASKENVIILQQKDYSSDGHMIGAQEWALSGIDRIEGPILSGNMVPDGETMDEYMQARGIQTGSTIVFMGNNSERLYFFFRYWGFPKDQLKILNGGLDAWEAAGYSLTTVEPEIAESNISISDLKGGLEEQVRASLDEMISGVEDGTVIPYATFARTTDLVTPLITGTLDGNFNPDYVKSDKFVFFQGQFKGQVQDEDILANDYPAGGAEYWKSGYNLAAGLYEGGKYLSAQDMRDYLKGILGEEDWKAVQKGGSKTIATFCRAGNLAATGFTPIEAVLGEEINVMLYDGSWSQWASLTNDPTIVPGDAWLLPYKEYDYTDWATDELTYAANDAGLPFYIIDAEGTIDLNDDGTPDAPSAFLEQPHFYEIVDLEAEDDDYRENGPEEESGPASATAVAGGGGC